MKQLLTLSILLIFCQVSSSGQKTKGKTNAEKDYFPEADTWKHQSLKDSGIDSLKLQSAILYAKDHETRASRNMELAQVMSYGKEPFDDGAGPFSERGDPTGLIIYKGYIVAEWGEPSRVDMTHSVTKSFLSTVVGLAFDQGLIKSVYDLVYTYMPPIEVYDPRFINRTVEELGKPQLLSPFSSEHNRSLSWDVMLRQTSDWEGTLWGKPEWADRPSNNPEEWMTRKRFKPGTVWEYNDVRVNALALATTSVWRKPLPQVLKEKIMDPIGASNTWRWMGYRNSWIVLDGQAVQSVSGGGHWGGGIFINAYDMARFGLLTLHNGNWKGKQLISERWVQQARTPTSVQPTYGYMNWFLNTDKKYLHSAPASAFAHIGNGTNMIYVDQEHELVMVVRWIDNNALDGMVKLALEALK